MGRMGNALRDGARNRQRPKTNSQVHIFEVSEVSKRVRDRAGEALVGTVKLARGKKERKREAWG